MHLCIIISINNTGQTEMTNLTAHDNIYLHRKATRVVELIADGKSTAEIAEITGLSQRNVKYYAEDAMHKLGADNRAHLVAVAFQHRILEFLSISMMMLAIGFTVVADDTDIRSQRGQLRTTRFSRTARTRGRNRDELLEPIELVTAA